MFSSAEKTTHAATAVQQKAQQQTFFRKVGEETFFGGNETSSFFGAPVQAKLSVSSPDDPQEKEADEVAEQVMRMPDVSPAAVTEKDERKVDKKEDEEEIYPKIETPAINRISLKEEKNIQNSQLIPLQRMPEDNYDADLENGLAGDNTETSVYRKHMNQYNAGLIQRSGRGPPGNSLNFGQSLSSSKGGGSPMSSNTLQFMESRFNADFSGVRIHAGAEANSMTSQINAQAFAHGNDVYFNEGKYAPQTQSGGTLLAHELTHTIQQGASPAIAPTSVATKSVARKNNLQRRTHSTRTPSSEFTRTSKIESGVTTIQSSCENIKINCSENNEEKEIAPEKEIQAKSDLSSWQVDPSGITDTSNLSLIQKSEEDKELQKKEEEQQEQEDEFVSPKLYSFQKKGMESGSATKIYGKQYNPLSTFQCTIQAKQSIANSSLTTDIQAPASAITEVRGRGPPVQLTTNGPEVIHRSALDDALAYTSLGALLECVDVFSLEATSACLLRKARDVAMHIPGYSALRVVLGSDPITGERVERNGHNFIEAAFGIMPGGHLLHQKLEEQHQLDAAAAWIDEKMAALEHIVSVVFSRFENFWDGLGLTDFGSPLEVMRQGAGIVFGFIDDIIDLAIEAGLELLKMVKDFLLESLVEFIKEKTPVYPLLTVILGEDPITKQSVDRNGTNILNALLALGGEEGQVQRDQLVETGTFDKVAGYIDEGIVVFGGLYETIIQNFSTIWSLISIESLMEPTETFNTIYAIFVEPVSKVLDFIERAVSEMLKLIKDVLFRRISAEAKKVKGYFLVTIIIEKDPFTDEVVPRNAENLIHGFMSLMDGGEEQFQQMKESGAIARTVDKVNAAVDRLNMTPGSIFQLFTDLWNSFLFSDFITPIPTFLRIINTFGEPLGRLVAFVVEIVKIVVVVILELMNFPFDLINNIISKAMLAFDLIKKDPIGFLKNLLRSIKEGFLQFFSNILIHLFTGLKEWFLGEIREAGIPIPTDFTVVGIIKWLLEVLDITMDKMWKKLEERIGKPKVEKMKKMIAKVERVASAVGEAYEFMKDVQERGFMAVIIDKVKEQLSNVWEIVMDAVKSFVMDQIIKKVTVKLLSMLDPTGIMAVVNSAIALYRAIQSFIKYLQQMLQIVNSFVEGTLQIAQGATKKAANILEGALAGGIPIVLGFFANQVGLNLSSQLKKVLEIVRAKVDKGLTWVVDKVVGLIERLVAIGRSGNVGQTAQQSVPNDPTAHRQLALEAKHELENAPVNATYPTEALQQKQQAARNIENSYSERLQSPLRMTITLVEQSYTEAVGQVSTRIVIAPNDTVLEDTIDINLAGGPTVLRVGTPLRRKEASDWTHGIISAIGSHETAGRSVTVQFGRDARGGTTTIIPISTLERDLAMTPDALRRSGYALDISGTDHRMYKPKELKSVNPTTSSVRLTYKTHADAEFTITINHENNEHTVTGRNLQLKDWAGVEGRGITQTPAGFIAGVNLNRAHLIADRFMGSGFVEGENLISTSADYNQNDMSKAENRLVSQIIGFNAENFDLTVTANFGNVSTTAVRDAIIESVPEAERGAVSAEIAAFATTHSGFDVCLRVTYNGIMKKAPNMTRGITAGPLGPDRYLRIK